MRFVVLTSRSTQVMQYIADDLCAAFNSLGHPCVVLKGEYTEHQMSLEYVSRFMDKNKPDAVIGMGHARGTMPWLPLDIPAVAWVFDDLAWFKDAGYTGRSQSEDIHYAILDEIEESMTEVDHVKLLGWAYNPAMYYPSSKPPTEAVTIISNLSERAAEQTSLHFRTRNRRLRDCARALIHAGIPLRIWGRGWDEKEFLPHWQGVVAPGPELRAAYQDSAIVMHTGVPNHMRIMEASACGALVLCACPGTGCHAPVHVDVGQASGAKHYINNAAGRLRWVTAAASAHRSGWTYQHRAIEIVKDLGG